MMNSVDDQGCELNRTVCWGNPLEAPSMSGAGCRAQDDTVALSNQIINGVLNIRKCSQKLPFEPFQFQSIHSVRAKLTYIMCVKKNIERTLKPSVCKCNPMTNE
jgi:hypothetical protein